MQAPIHGKSVTLDTTIAAEVPKYYTGAWAPTEALGFSQQWNPAFNSTIPTIKGRVKNNIFPLINETLQPTLASYIAKLSPLVGVFHGCPGLCKAKLRAPAVRSTCVQHELPANYSQPLPLDMRNRIVNGLQAPPLDRQLFMITSNLVEEENETINLVSTSVHELAQLTLGQKCSSRLT